ncbi:MAG: ATP-binding protein [Spirochaetales bacterium]|nr:ATP-binding protein [Spirochaetales bacterium]
MHNKVPRALLNIIHKRLGSYPAVALLGARQVGKTTLARQIVEQVPGALYLDLQKASDRAKIENDPELFLQLNKDHLVCLDEIQLLPEIFSSMRSSIDDTRRPGQFLMLGSASRDLIRQSSESLAGRIAYLDITPFTRTEIEGLIPQEKHWLKGGYPGSLLKDQDEESFEWRWNYIQTFLERDIPQLGFSIPAKTLERMWTMLAHTHGQLVNYSNLGKSLGVTHHTIKSYIDILEQTFVVRTLKPYEANLGKRLVKSPKVYIRDTGLLHALLGIETMNGLLGHPVVGNSFESYVIENVLTHMPRWEPSFFRDATGNEVDLVLSRGNQLIAVEIKSSTAPKVEKGFWNSLKLINPDEIWIIGQVDGTYPGPQGSTVSGLRDFLREH